MKIGMILDAPFPPDYRVEKEALTLLENGHEVFLFCLTYEKKFYEENYKGIKLAHYKSNTLEYKLSALAYTIPLYHFFMKSKIKDFIRRYRPEVLHVHDMVIAAAALSAARDEKIKTVLDLHENRPEIMKEYRHLQKFPGKYLIDLNVWKKKQVELARGFDKVVVVTELAKNIISREAQIDKDNVAVLPNTPSLNFLSYATDNSIVEKMKGKFNLLYIGDTSARRGTEDMLSVVKELKDILPTICLWVIGKSSFDAQLELTSRKLKIEQLVRFEGWQPEKLFPSFIIGSQVCLSPLKRNLHHDTTFANKVFQYMSLGRPVVVSDCTAQADLIESERSGLVFKAGDISDFKAKILTLLENQSLRDELGRNAKLAVEERWNWEKTSDSLVRIYNSIKF